MKVIFLPGMDGTGRLFEPFIKHFSSCQIEIIPLPQAGTQHYEELANYVFAKLPNENYILVGESFSGPIVAAIAARQSDYLMGVIFVATFLTPPNKLLLKIGQYLPLTQLSQFAISRYFLRYLMLGLDANDELVSQFVKVVADIPSDVLRKRMQSILALRMPTSKINIPSLYLRAKDDKLVPTKKGDDFHLVFQNLTLKAVGGPHFILQNNPDQCSRLITQWINEFIPYINH